MPFIRYTSRNNVVYATLVESVRVKEEVDNEKSYKIKQKYIEKLGVVIDTLIFPKPCPTKTLSTNREYAYKEVGRTMAAFLA